MKRLLCLLAALAVLLPRGHAAEPRCVALTFDDGPSGALTERLLDGLAARGVHATFFLCGYRIDLYPELAARIAAEGHETGTHGDTHSYFTSMSRAEVCRVLPEHYAHELDRHALHRYVEPLQGRPRHVVLCPGDFAPDLYGRRE